MTVWAILGTNTNRPLLQVLDFEGDFEPTEEVACQTVAISDPKMIDVDVDL